MGSLKRKNIFTASLCVSGTKSILWIKQNILALGECEAIDSRLTFKSYFEIAVRCKFID